MSKTYQAISYLKYWLDAMDRHSLQAPFIYDLYTQVIRPKGPQVDFTYIEVERTRLENSKDLIPITDFGAGSHVDNSKERRISDIAKKGISKSKYSEMLVRLGNYLGSHQILELGTSLGINTLYLSGITDSHITTFEGSTSLVGLASSLFEAHNKSNVTVVEGDINLTLPELLEGIDKIDMMFFDANHQYESTRNYFNWCKKYTHKKSCFVFDDIHLSPQMGKAWDEICANPLVTLSIDLFQVGMVFFNPELTKRHYVLEF